MNKKQLILGAGAAALLVVAIVYYATRPNAKAVIPNQVTVHCACLACQKHVELEVATRAQAPYECPDCGERAAYPLFLCSECGKYGVPVLQAGEEFPKIPMIPSCSACGKQPMMGYMGNGDDIPPDDQLALPKWPQ